MPGVMARTYSPASFETFGSYPRNTKIVPAYDNIMDTQMKAKNAITLPLWSITPHCCMSPAPLAIDTSVSRAPLSP